MLVGLPYSVTSDSDLESGQGMLAEDFAFGVGTLLGRAPFSWLAVWNHKRFAGE